MKNARIAVFRNEFGFKARGNMSFLFIAPLCESVEQLKITSCLTCCSFEDVRKVI